MAESRGAASRARAARRRAQGRVRGAPRRRLRRARARGAARARPSRRAVGAAARARSAHPASARRRVPGHLAIAAPLARAADGGLAARRRAHAVSRRRSDAIDLSVSRRRHVAVPAREAARHRRGAAAQPHVAAQLPQRAGDRELGQRGVRAAFFRPPTRSRRGAPRFARAARRATAEGAQFVRTHAAAARRAARSRASSRFSRRSGGATPAQSIAVLVQSRTHLEGLRERLRERGLAVHAVEIDSLGEQSVAQDLAGLTRALLHLDDRIAWLAVLRAPWCGLSFRGPRSAVRRRSRVGDLGSAAASRERAARLSADGQARAAQRRRDADGAFATREHATLSRWVERTWIELGGPACLDDDAERAIGGAVLRVARGSGARRRPRRSRPAATRARDRAAASRCAARAGHRDHDDAPREGARVRHRRAARPRARAAAPTSRKRCSGSRGRRPTGATTSSWCRRRSRADPDGERLADFVRRAERERDAAERARLLYVATTRARERLHLVWQLPSRRRKRRRRARCSHICGPSFPRRRAKPSAGGRSCGISRRASCPCCAGSSSPRRRAASVSAPRACPCRCARSSSGPAKPPRTSAPSSIVTCSASRSRGSSVGPRNVSSNPSLRSRASSSCSASTPRSARAQPTASSRRCRAALADRHGRWVLGPHDEARSELRLTLRAGAALEHVRLDRTFVADGTRWIVDFKTSQHEGGELERVSRLRGRALCAAARALCARRRRDRLAPRAARLVLSVARRASRVARSRYSEPVKLSRRRPSASGSAVMIFSPSTSISGAPARGSTSASSV